MLTAYNSYIHYHLGREDNVENKNMQTVPSESLGPVRKPGTCVEYSKNHRNRLNHNTKSSIKKKEREDGNGT